MKLRTTLVPLSFVLVITLFAGCASTPFKKPSYSSASKDAQGLEVSSYLRFDDVPVPYGFKIQPEESFAFQNDFSRVGLLRYEGKASPEQLVTFYREQMAFYNWQMVNIIEFGMKVLNFEKSDQNCIVMIESGRAKTSLVLAIAPKSTMKNSSIIKPLKKSE